MLNNIKKLSLPIKLNNLLHSRLCLSSISLRNVSNDNSSINRYTERTHNCGQLTKSDVGKNVTLFGWVQYTRFNNKIITLRDSYGLIQCILSSDNLAKTFKKINIYNESVIKVTGTVRERPHGQQTSNYQTGSIEIAANDLQIVTSAKQDLPILTRDNNNSQTTWNNRLRYRHLDLRSNEMQHALRFRSHVCRILRDKLYEYNFIECETPTLYNRTPGGANEFIVPTREAGQFYNLVQSPQQLKQLLMIGGLDRYFQICRCYRDEATRFDRQPEFTQLDIELSFTNQKLIHKLISDLVYHLMTIITAHDPLMREEFTKSFDNNKEIRKITFKDAFNKYGTDKPDTRFEWLIEEVEQNKLNLTVPHTIEDIELVRLIDKVVKMDATNQSNPINFHQTDKNTTFTTQDKSDSARKLLGKLRIVIAKFLEENNSIRVYNQIFSFVWVTDFPLFSIGDDGKLEPNHHPFTAPTNESTHLLKSKPLDVIGQHYDLVLNGQEVAGGSIRINDAGLQKQIFTEILHLEEKTFKYFIDALESGCPPHGGIAFGLDRLIAILMNKSSIRDVIAFPKSSSGRDPLSECPHELSDDVKSLYHIKG